MAQSLQPENEWEISKVASSVVEREGVNEFRAGDVSFSTISKVILGTALGGERYGSAYDETDNELLGIKELTEEDLKKMVAEKLA